MCDSVTRANLVRFVLVGIEKSDPDLTAVSRIDRAGRVHDGDAVLARQTASRHNKRDIPVWQRNRQTRGKGHPLTRLQHRVNGGAQVSARIARMGVCRNGISDNKNLDRICHVTRVVQKSDRIEIMQRYRERLHPSVVTLIPVILIIPASILVFAPINFVAGCITAVVLFIGAIALLYLGSPVIRVVGNELHAGRAHISTTLLGETEIYRGADARRERGPALDARAWLCIRGWVDPVVKIQITDPQDPTPYWLVSSRKPEQLVRALREAASQ